MAPSQRARPRPVRRTLGVENMVTEVYCFASLSNGLCQMNRFLNLRSQFVEKWLGFPSQLDPTKYDLPQLNQTEPEAILFCQVVLHDVSQTTEGR